MANSFGSLYIGSSSLRNHQNALHTTANNLANVGTTGYVREQVLFADETYINFGRAAISPKQYGLGVTIGDVVHARDIFLDKLYRDTAAREAFYETSYEAAYEVQTYFQEMEGKEFQEAMNDFWNALNDFAANPGDSTAQNMIVQKTSLFVSRAQAVYKGLKSYQNNINTQISQQVDQVNKMAKTIYELNREIQRIESGKVETAMDLRDARDQVLDELSAIGKIEVSEDADGIVRVRFENHDLVDEAHVYEMGKKIDKVTDFVTPYWINTSDITRNDYDEVFDFTIDISADMNTDMGSLKALVLARGERPANYYDLFHKEDGTLMNNEEYLDGIGMSLMENTQAEFDHLIHAVVTTINDLFCPNAEMAEDGVYYDGNGDVLYQTITDPATGKKYLADKDGNAYKDAAGSQIEVADGTKFLDVKTAPVGEDGELPPRELFARIGCDRYTEIEVLDANGNAVTLWQYNEEDFTDTSKMYTTANIVVNEDLLKVETNLPHLKNNGPDYPVDYSLGEKLLAAWEAKSMILNLSDTEECSFEGCYEKLVNEVGSLGNIYWTTSETMSEAVLSADNKRQQVIGVSTDEELTNMIKYQNGYNAASRYINVIAAMIDTLINMAR